MRVLSISGKKRSTKRRSSKLRRRKGRYSGGGNSEEEVQKKQFERLAQATQAAQIEEFKNDEENSTQVPANNDTDDGVDPMYDFKKDGVFNSLARLTPFQQIRDFKGKITDYFEEEENKIEDDTFNNLFANDSNTFIDNINRIINRTMSVPGLLSDAEKNKINNFNLLIILISRFIDRVKTQNTDIRKRMLMLLFAIMHGISVVQSELKKIKPDIDIPDIPQPANVYFDVLKLSDGLTPDEINDMTRAITSMKETMNESNSINVQGKDLKIIYDEILQPLYNKLTEVSDPERMNGIPTGITPASLPPGESLDRKVDNKPQVSLLQPIGPAPTLSSTNLPGPRGNKELKGSRKQSSILSSTGVSDPRPESTVKGGKSRKRKSRSRRSTRKKSRKSSRRRTRH